MIEQGSERRPEGGDVDMTSELVAGYHDQARLAPMSGDDVARDLLSRVDAGQISEEQAEEVLFRLGLFHRSEGSYD